jgi:pantothenate kinase-related protein Tda10
VTTAGESSNYTDFYLPYKGLKELASRYPENTLLSGRGPPGTHDAPLLSTTLSAIRDINRTAQPVALPIFDKSLNGGYGDRSSESVPVQSPLDVFLLEGWSLGFEPVSSVTDLHRAGRVASKHPESSITQINDNLAAFASHVHANFDVHIAVRPESYDYVYAWRLEQEHNMKRANGGKGMSDEEVEAFVDRYMPCYELYGTQTVARPSLVLTYGRDREVV